MAEEKKVKEQETVDEKKTENTCSEKPQAETKEEDKTTEKNIKEEVKTTGTKVKEEDKKQEKKGKPKKKKRKSDKAKYQETIEKMQSTIAEMQDKHLRLQAEFDNYRKRTLKEKMELIKSGGESVLTSLLPVIDDFERALASISKAEDDDPVKQGVVLILKKFEDFLKQNGIKEIEAKGKDFDTDQQEAITKIPAPSEDLKGKVVDVIQKGYLLNDKVIRFAKVVIGE